MTTATDTAAALRARLSAELATAHARDALTAKLDEAGALAAWVGAVSRDPATQLAVEVTLAPAGGGDGWRLVPHRVDGLITEFAISRHPEEV